MYCHLAAEAPDGLSCLAERSGISWKYLHRSVVEQLLDAANWAPTHGKTEPWKFVVLGRDKQEEMCDLTLKVCCATLLPRIHRLLRCLVYQRCSACPYEV